MASNENMEGERLEYPPALKKKGLEPGEFKKLLESKMTKLFKLSNTSDLKPSVEGSIDDVIQNCVLRENSDGSLDRRRRSNTQMHNEGILQDPRKSPSKVQSQKRKQGRINPATRNRHGYHNYQSELFSKLLEQDKLDRSFSLSGNSPETNEEGYLYKDGVKCTTEAMCNALDDSTLQYIDDLSDSGTDQGQQTTEAHRKHLRIIFDLCKPIVMGRVYEDWAIENDILSKDGYKQWKEHVWVLMSCAALLVIIDVLSKTPKYGSNSLLLDGKS